MGPVASIALASLADARARFGEVRRGVVLTAVAALLGLTAWAMVMTAAVLGLIRLTGDPLLSLVLAVAALVLVAGLIVTVAMLLRRKARKAREARQARRALALTTAFALVPSGRTGTLATAAIALAGLGYALWPDRGSKD